MELPVLIKKTKDQRVSAQVVGIAELSVEADTEETALKELKASYDRWLGNNKLIALSVDHPWLKWAGWAKDDPTFEMYLEEIARGRREADERERADQDEPDARLSA